MLFLTSRLSLPSLSLQCWLKEQSNDTNLRGGKGKYLPVRIRSIFGVILGNKTTKWINYPKFWSIRLHRQKLWRNPWRESPEGELRTIPLWKSISIYFQKCNFFINKWSFSSRSIQHSASQSLTLIFHSSTLLLPSRPFINPRLLRETWRGKTAKNFRRINFLFANR